MYTAAITVVATRRARALEAFLAGSFKADVAIHAMVTLAALVSCHAAFGACSVQIEGRISRRSLEVAIQLLIRARSTPVVTTRAVLVSAWDAHSFKANVAIRALIALAALIPCYAAFDACSVQVKEGISRGSLKVAIQLLIRTPNVTTRTVLVSAWDTYWIYFVVIAYFLVEALFIAAYWSLWWWIII